MTLIEYHASGYGGSFDDIILLVHKENEYAVVQAAAGVAPCRAQALGGVISALTANQMCPALSSCTRTNGQGGPQDTTAYRKFHPGQWLSVPAAEGRHHYEFRYHPRDGAIGLSLSFVGVILSLTLSVTRSPICACAPY